MNPETLDWEALERLRTVFLAGTAGAADYWTSESALAAYDATFAQRIGWKWDFVLRELQARGWTLPAGDLLDWGCGSGVAGRAVLDFFGAAPGRRLRLWDRAPLARNFARERAKARYPGLEVIEETAPAPTASGTLLLSHVLTELTQPQTETLVAQVATAECVIWVEPGTYEASLTLIAIRERLRAHFQLVAPCPHQGRCGILAPENERHWCHHFAAPPNAVFQDPGWATFANRLNIDLRDLPLSFLVLDRRAAPTLPADAARLLGHPRLYKAHALMLGCDAAGVRERTLSRRAFPDEFKQLRKGRHASLYRWQCDGEAIVQMTPAL